MSSGEISQATDSSSAKRSETHTRYLSPEQLRTMAEAGMTIGSHSITHRRLTALPPDEAIAEIEGSKRQLEALLQRPVQWFSYPYGNFSKAVARAVQDAGYLGATSAIRDNRVKPQQLYYLPRVMVMSDASPIRFGYYFGGLYHFLHRRKNKRRWGKFI